MEYTYWKYIVKYLQTPDCSSKVKYKLSRKNLQKLYLVYIRPIFEYACEVWDNFGVGNSNKIDQLQLEAARIVTVLPIFASSILTYKELGWESLAERRKRRTLQMFYNIQNRNAPRYLLWLNSTNNSKYNRLSIA